MVAWVLAWVAHAMLGSPGELLSPPINFPAPHQLTGSEHLASTQLVFAPIFWLTGNAVLGANLATFLSYPLAGFAMQRLLVALGCRASVAWVGGVHFALGPQHVPASLHTLQYMNLFLPVVSLALLRLARHPTARRAAVLGITLVASLFSSYYMAVLILLVAAIWAGHAVVRRTMGVRALGFAAAAAAGGCALLLVASVPYFGQSSAADAAAGLTAAIRGRIEAQGVALPSPLGVLNLFLPVFPGTSWKPSSWALCWGVFPIGLGLAALGARRGGDVRAIATVGLALGVVGTLLMLGPRLTIAGYDIPLPLAVLEHSPARFFRVPARFSIIVGFATTLLGSAGLEQLCRRIGSASGRAALLITSAAGVVLTVGIHLCDGTPVAIRAASQDAATYRRLGGVVRELGGGPFAELPVPRRPSLTWGVERRIGITHHWLPSVFEYTGYLPPHTRLVQELLVRLPDADALADLVDVTHLRWLILRPAGEWPASGERARLVAELIAQKAVATLRDVDGWLLVRLAREPQHPQWFATVAAGGVTGATALGTPLAPLSTSAATGQIVVGSSPPVATAGRAVPIGISVRNLGDAAWPVAVGDGYYLARDGQYVIGVTAEWVPRDGGSSSVAREVLPLRRDVPPGETMRDTITPIAPTTPGPYELRLELTQIGGTPFTTREEDTVRPSILVRAGDG